MDIFSSPIILLIILGIIFNIIKKSKAAQKSASSDTATNSTAQKKPYSLQEIIQQQVQEQKNASMGMAQKSAQPAAKPAPKNIPEDKFAKMTSMEKQRYAEGDALLRETLEGESSEMKRHSHNAHLGGSYNEGDKLNRYSLEGGELFDDSDEMSLDVAASVSRRGKSKTGSVKLKKSEVGLKFDAGGVVNGIIMSEVLGKRGGRRAL